MPGTRVYLDVKAWDGNVVLFVKNVSREPLNIPADRLMERFVRGEESRTTEGPAWDSPSPAASPSSREGPSVWTSTGTFQGSGELPGVQGPDGRAAALKSLCFSLLDRIYYI
ncbi:MAG: hypothetical protein ACLSAF_21320 [Intestinimonas sp.]